MIECRKRFLDILSLANGMRDGALKMATICRGPFSNDSLSFFFPFFFLGISMHFSHSAQQLWHVTTFRSDFVRETLTLMNRLIKIDLECVLCFQTRSLFRKFLLNASEKNISFSKIVQRKMKLMSQVSPFNMHSPFSYLWNIIWFITLWKKK